MAQDTTGREYPDSNHPNWAGASRHPEAAAPLEGAVWGSGGTPTEIPEAVVVDTADGYVFGRASWIGGGLFTVETAQAFAGSRNASSEPGRYVVRLLAEVPDEDTSWTPFSADSS
jgi:hypothetical protein